MGNGGTRDKAQVTWSPPASYLQEDWFGALDPRASNYNVLATWALSGDVAAEVACEALTALGMRHEVLRTSLEASGGAIRQVVHAGLEPDVEVVDLEGEADPEKAAARLVAAEAARPFDLGTAPLWRARVMRLASGQQVIAVVQNHAISDGWSAGVALRDFARLYRGLALDGEPTLAPAELHFGDYATWEREVREPEAEAEWRARFGSPVQRAALPAASGRQAEGEFDLVAVPLPAIDATTARALRAAGRRRGASMTAVLCAGAAASLVEYAREHLAVGVAWANRERPEVQGMMGPLFDYLPVRLAVSETSGFRQLLDQAVSGMRFARECRLPVGRIGHAVTVGDEDAAGKLCDVIVNFTPHHAEPHVRIGLKDGAAAEITTWPFNLTRVTVRARRNFFGGGASFVVRESARGVLGGLIYGNGSAMSPRSIGELGARFASTLEAVSRDPDAVVGTLAHRSISGS